MMRCGGWVRWRIGCGVWCSLCISELEGMLVGVACLLSFSFGIHCSGSGRVGGIITYIGVLFDVVTSSFTPVLSVGEGLFPIF